MGGLIVRDRELKYREPWILCSLHIIGLISGSPPSLVWHPRTAVDKRCSGASLSRRTFCRIDWSQSLFERASWQCEGPHQHYGVEFKVSVGAIRKCFRTPVKMRCQKCHELGSPPMLPSGSFSAHLLAWSAHWIVQFVSQQNFAQRTCSARSMLAARISTGASSMMIFFFMVLGGFVGSSLRGARAKRNFTEARSDGPIDQVGYVSAAGTVQSTIFEQEFLRVLPRIPARYLKWPLEISCIFPAHLLVHSSSLRTISGFFWALRRDAIQRLRRASCRIPIPSFFSPHFLVFLAFWKSKSSSVSSGCHVLSWRDLMRFCILGEVKRV